MGNQIRLWLPTCAASRRPRILDVSSPKCFGLYLAYHFDVEVHLTDIDYPSVREAEVLWDAIKGRAKGNAVFSVQDARYLQYQNEEFDIVYSMSVIEHVGGSAGDTEAMKEMARVLNVGGLLLVTVPIGQNYVEQEILGFEGAARYSGDRRLYFFQRIYSPQTANERLLHCTSTVQLREALTVCRSNSVVARSYLRLGYKARCLLGFLDPVLSKVMNRTMTGVVAAPSRYGKVNTSRDLYGDLMLAWDKGAGTTAMAPLAQTTLVPDEVLDK
jgi:SAM-dependent methyltransferase